MLAKVGSSWSSTPTSLSNIKSKSSTTTKKEDDETNLDLERERDWLQREIAREENRMRQLKAKRAGVTIADTATSAATAAASSSSSPNAEHETDDFLQRLFDFFVLVASRVAITPKFVLAQASFLFPATDNISIASGDKSMDV